jgi:glycosyltransferase involved in cell wall biosynthesis
MRVPRVSVVCCFFNEERFLVEAIESVLAQSLAELELILVDDGSTDRSRSIAERFAAADQRIVVVGHPGDGNRGLSASRNLGISVASAARIAFIDGDDRWPAEKLAEQVAIMDRHPEVSLLAGGARYWSSWAGGIDEVRQIGTVRDRVISPPDALLSTYPLGDAEAPGVTGFLVSAEAIARIGGFEEAFPGMYEDQAFLAKMYLGEPVYFSSHCWFDYRQHDGSMLAAATRRGQYLDARGRFLDWFAHYIAEREVDDLVTQRLRQARGDVRRALRRRTLSRVRSHLLTIARAPRRLALR